MKLLRNVSPLGPVDLPLVGRILEAGEEFEVTDEQAGRPPSGTPGEDDWHPGEGLLGQVDNFVLAEGPDDVDAMNVAELRKYAAAHDIDLAGAKKKADILAAIKGEVHDTSIPDGEADDNGVVETTDPRITDDEQEG